MIKSPSSNSHNNDSPYIKKPVSSPRFPVLHSRTPNSQKMKFIPNTRTRNQTSSVRTLSSNKKFNKSNTLSVKHVSQYKVMNLLNKSVDQQTTEESFDEPQIQTKKNLALASIEQFVNGTLQLAEELERKTTENHSVEHYEENDQRFVFSPVFPSFKYRTSSLENHHKNKKGQSEKPILKIIPIGSLKHTATLHLQRKKTHPIENPYLSQNKKIKHRSESVTTKREKDDDNINSTSEKRYRSNPRTNLKKEALGNQLDGVIKFLKKNEEKQMIKMNVKNNPNFMKKHKQLMEKFREEIKKEKISNIFGKDLKEWRERRKNRTIDYSRKSLEQITKNDTFRYFKYKEFKRELNIQKIEMALMHSRQLRYRKPLISEKLSEKQDLKNRLERKKDLVKMLLKNKNNL